MSKVKVGIIGSAGYTGGELIRILINHPDAAIKFVHSKSNAGNLVSDVHADLLGETDLKFSSELSDDIDVLFLCSGHNESLKFLSENVIADHIKIIDLSHDFRIKKNLSEITGLKSVSAQDFVYGLPELNKAEIKTAKHIANPGCFATCLQLALLPLAHAQQLNNDVHISAITGSTGAGQSLSPTTRFSWRNNNISVYKAFTHQHLREVYQSAEQLQQGFNKRVNFIPYRGDFTRGIFASCYLTAELSRDEAIALFQDYYAEHPFTVISNSNPDLKQVVNTNKCILYLEKHEDQLLVLSMIDNLVKGASGQAVQNMNLLSGLKETAGLGLKSVAF